MWWCMPIIPTPARSKQEDQELWVILGNIQSLRPAWTTGDLVSKREGKTGKGKKGGNEGGRKREREKREKPGGSGTFL